MKNNDRYQVPLAKDIMTSKVISVEGFQDVGSVVKTFNKHKISGAPVLRGATKEVIGFISEEDLMQELAQESYNYEQTPETFPVTVQAIMSKQVLSIGPNLDIFEVVRFFHKNKLRHAPVMDEGKNLCGIVSRRDLLQALEKMIDKTGDFAIASRTSLKSRIVSWKEKFSV